MYTFGPNNFFQSTRGLRLPYVSPGKTSYVGYNEELDGSKLKAVDDSAVLELARELLGEHAGTEVNSIIHRKVGETLPQVAASSKFTATGSEWFKSPSPPHTLRTSADNLKAVSSPSRQLVYVRPPRHPPIHSSYNETQRNNQAADFKKSVENELNPMRNSYEFKSEEEQNKFPPIRLQPAPPTHPSPSKPPRRSSIVNNSNRTQPMRSSLEKPLLSHITNRSLKLEGSTPQIRVQAALRLQKFSKVIKAKQLVRKMRQDRLEHREKINRELVMMNNLVRIQAWRRGHKTRQLAKQLRGQREVAAEKIQRAVRRHKAVIIVKNLKEKRTRERSQAEQNLILALNLIRIQSWFRGFKSRQQTNQTMMGAHIQLNESKTRRAIVNEYDKECRDLLVRLAGIKRLSTSIQELKSRSILRVHHAEIAERNQLAKNWEGGMMALRRIAHLNGSLFYAEERDRKLIRASEWASRMAMLQEFETLTRLTIEAGAKSSIRSILLNDWSKLMAFLKNFQIRQIVNDEEAELMEILQLQEIDRRLLLVDRAASIVPNYSEATSQPFVLQLMEAKGRWDIEYEESDGRELQMVLNEAVHRFEIQTREDQNRTKLLCGHMEWSESKIRQICSNSQIQDALYLVNIQEEFLRASYENEQQEWYQRYPTIQKRLIMLHQSAIPFQRCWRRYDAKKYVFMLKYYKYQDNTARRKNNEKERVQQLLQDKAKVIQRSYRKYRNKRTVSLKNTNKSDAMVVIKNGNGKGKSSIGYELVFGHSPGIIRGISAMM